MRVDWDLLADHLGGGLSGTPREAEVAELIATDPAWAQAAADLTGAFETVHAALGRLDPPAMPDDIADRLDGVLRDALAPAAAPPAGQSTGGALAESRAGDTRVPSPRRSTRPGGGRQRSAAASGPGSHRPGRRFARWGAGVAVAAGVVAFAAIGMGGIQLPTRSAADNAEAGAAVPDTLDAQPPRQIVEEPGLAATGTDYRAGALASSPPEPVEDPMSPPGDGRDGGPDPGQSAPEVAAEPVGPQVTVPPALDRLWSDPQAREDCLALVVEAVEPAPVTIAVVDFAHFRGEPALVIWITAGDGAELVRVVGPGCGTATSGADLRYQTQVR